MAQRPADFDKWNALAKLNVGDKVKLTNGDTAEFVKLKQKNFDGIINEKCYSIPVNMFVEVTEKVDKAAKTGEIDELRSGDPFYISKNGNAMLFIFEKIESGRIIGINPVSKARHRIDKELFAGKVEGI